ncbi:MAG: valine--tRNA ligase [Puniceicoccaceae bacterium]|nr:MAG: valine--tRNA ligase [Puniceicoccaceae bacterium]
MGSSTQATGFSQNYDPAAVEQKWRDRWVAGGCFRGRVDPERPAYSIVIPPPNVTGMLTMGHVLNNTIQDILARRARMTGHSVLWLPGTDHAGIATQTRVERELRRTEGKTRHDLGREAFLKRVWQWREHHGDLIIEQLKRLGCSCDWERTVFTMDPEYSRRVLKAFVELYRRGFIYRGHYMVNWCPVSLTALSDEEVIMKPQQGILYKMRYEVAEHPGTFLEIATTRPETLMGDTAVAVHPEDDRYRHLVGCHAWRPFPRAKIPIIADDHIDREFGTGVLKVTPAHDKADFEIGQRHHLPVLDVLNPDGTLNALAGEDFDGLDRFEGRKKAAEKLRALGLLVGEEPYENNVGFSERADVPIEPRISEQWFLRYPQAEEAKRVIEDGTIRFHPERWTKVYMNWMNNIRDWCISRQLWWGHRIPVWYRKGADRSDAANWHVDLEPPADPENWEQEEDVLDTWASSWLWPFATMGWGDPGAEKAEGLDYFYPTSALVTGPDIIFLWVARMIMAGLEFMRPGEAPARRIPFRDVYFTGIVRDIEGRKMSKSLGNSPDPLELIRDYGADGLRLGVISIAPQGQDIRFSNDRVETGRNFCTKLWNACRFRLLSGPAGDNASLPAILARIDPGALEAEEHSLLLGMVEVTRDLEKAFAGYEFSQACQRLHAFFWGDFCDWYVEVSKAKLKDSSAGTVLAVQDAVLRQLLLLLHPFIPHITEELWELLGYNDGDLPLMATALPLAKSLEEALAAAGIRPDPKSATLADGLKQLVSAARALKAEHRLASSRDVRFFFTGGSEEAALIRSYESRLTRLIGAAAIEPKETVDGCPATLTPLGNLFLDLSASVDVGAERERLSKEIEKTQALAEATRKRLGNPAFVDKAPPPVVEGARRQLSELEAKVEELERLRGALG